MTGKQAAELLDKHHNFFASMKCKQKPEYEHILTLRGNNLHEQYLAYTDEQKIVMDELCRLYYWLEEHKLISKFSKSLYAIGLFTNNNTFSAHASSIIFNGAGEFPHYPTYVKYKRILILMISFQKKEIKNMTYEPGSILKRLHYDFQEVEVIEIDEQYTKIKDASGFHFVENNLVKENFELVTKEEVLKVRNTHQNLDDDKRHNIAGSMNRPSRDQLVDK